MLRTNDQTLGVACNLVIIPIPKPFNNKKHIKTKQENHHQPLELFESRIISRFCAFSPKLFLSQHRSRFPGRRLDRINTAGTVPGKVPDKSCTSSKDTPARSKGKI